MQGVGAAAVKQFRQFLRSFKGVTLAVVISSFCSTLKAVELVFFPEQLQRQYSWKRNQWLSSSSS